MNLKKLVVGLGLFAFLATPLIADDHPHPKEGAAATADSHPHPGDTAHNKKPKKPAKPGKKGMAPAHPEEAAPAPEAGN